jgi:methylenetetrahydrofolate dehydrogenase (NADP+)/methenyltetrahydrofolate cyclohydrolase
MVAQILDGRVIAKAIQQEITDEVTAFQNAYGSVPTIAVVRAGEDPASVSYARMIKRSFERAGMGFALHQQPEDTTQEKMLALINWLNVDESVHGIMVQEPLPRGIDDLALKAALSPEKDADGVSPINAGRLALAAPVGSDPGVLDFMVPATPLGGLELLLRSGVEISGKRAVIVGRSNIVGRPMALLLMQHHATVSICHSRTRPLGAVTREADILCAAVGVPKLIKGDMVKPGAIVIDFGVNFVDGEMCGDVDFDEVVQVAGMITPVPGGTGPMTNAMLMRNVLESAKRLVAQKNGS